MFMTIKKGSWSLEEHLRNFKSIYDNLDTIKQLILDLDKIFQLPRGLGFKVWHFFELLCLQNHLTYHWLSLSKLFKTLNNLISQREMKKKCSWNIPKPSSNNKVVDETIITSKNGNTFKLHCQLIYSVFIGYVEVIRRW